MDDGQAVKSDLVDIEVTVRRETDKAWGIASPHKAGEIIWLPKSQCEIDGDNDPSRRAVLTAPRWLIEDKGLESLA